MNLRNEYQFIARAERLKEIEDISYILWPWGDTNYIFELYFPISLMNESEANE